MANSVLDVLGIGLGPFNISLNCLLAKTGLDSLFIDKNKEFSWHPYCMGGNLQVSWLKDCVSAIDPTNFYSFLNYVSKNGLFYQFAARKCDVITRLEYNDYLRWILSHFKNIHFNSNAQRLRVSDKGYYIVETDKDIYTAKSIVVGTGCVPNIPNFAKKYIGDDVFHSSVYMKHRKQLRGKILVVGNGQSACEIVMDLLNSNNDLGIIWISNASTFHSLDDNAIINSLYSPSYTKEIKKTSQNYKKTLFNNLLYTSDGVSSLTANQLFETIYNKKKEICLSLDTTLCNLDKSDDGYNANMFLKKFNKYKNIAVNKIILCTGYKQSIPTFLLESDLLDASCSNLLNEDFSCKVNANTKGKIYIQNFSRNIIGPIDSNLSIMPWRNAVIINSILQSNFYNSLDSEHFFFSALKAS